MIFLWADGHLHRIKHQTLDKTTIMILTGATNTDVISQIRQYILDEAHKKGIISETKILGPGVWKFENAFLIHTGTQAFSYDGKSLTKIEEPTYSNHIIEFSNEDWIRCKSLKEGLSGGDLSTAFHKLHDYIKPFSWAEAEIGEYAACFTMLAPLQQAMSWRPLLYLLGPRGCGKTLFLDHILSTIYGPLVCSLDKATSYAMAQEIGNTGRIGVFDEFENNKRMSEIIEHAKIFGRERGGYIKRGTPGAQALSYKLNHMVWFASIYSARQLRTDSAASSRAIIFNMKKPDINGIPPAKMSAKAGRKLAGYIVGTMIRHWTQISDVKEEIIRNPPIAQGKSPSRVESRTIENFAYANAILNIVLKQHRCVPNWANPEIEDDGDKILRSIMESVVSERGGRCTIGNLLEEAGKDSETYGIKRLANGDLAIRHAAVERYLLRDTPYSDLDISGPLTRLPGATRKKERIAGATVMCIVIPARVWLSAGGQQDGNGFGNAETTTESDIHSSVSNVSNNYIELKKGKNKKRKKSPTP